MKVLLLYRPKSESARIAEEFVHEYEHRDASRKIEIMDIDSREGSAMATLYDVVQQPAIMVLSDDGKMVQMWAGPQLPLMDEVAAYATSSSGMLVAREL